MQPLLSICCITFNHGEFLRDALDGFLSQKTSFSFEVLIHDDCSTDNTREIIEEYVKKYPGVIHPIYQTENQYSKGVRGINAQFNISRARGKYIAICEGDDYWTDTLKLQKQIDFLENNEGFNMCVHFARMINEKTGLEKIRPDYKKTDYVFDDVATGYLKFPTASFVFKNNIDIPNWFYGLHGGDRGIIFLNAMKGKIKLMDFVGCVYRIHDGGVSQIYNAYKIKQIIRATEDHCVYFNQVTNRKHKRMLFKKIYKNLLHLILNAIKEKRVRLFISFSSALFYFTFGKTPNFNEDKKRLR